MSKGTILNYLGLLENGALNYYQAIETIKIASQSIQNYIEQLEEQNKKQKEIIDKAIDLLKHQIDILESKDMFHNGEDELLSILEGKEV